MIIGGILVLFIYITRLASNEIFSPSNKIPYFSIDNTRVIYTKRTKFVKNEHARYTLERYER